MGPLKQEAPRTQASVREHLEGRGHVVSRFIAPISHIIAPTIPIFNGPTY